jgi:hypothetical protein
MSTSEALLVPRCESGWRIGLASMLSKELAAWWRTRRGWVQCLVALLVLNGLFAVNLKGNIGPKAIENATLAFLVTAALCVPFAAVSLAQDSILGEKHSGTAAWVLSKPLRRPPVTGNPFADQRGFAKAGGSRNEGQFTGHALAQPFDQGGRGTIFRPRRWNI